MFSNRLVGAAIRRMRMMRDVVEPGVLRHARRSRALESLHGFAFTKLIVVCQGNINRSAFAEAYARLRAPSLPVESCGLHRVSGRPSPELSISAAASLGVALGAHRSQSTVQLSIDGALIVGFEEHHLHAWPDVHMHGARTILLGTFSENPRTRLYLPDPYRQSLAYTTRVFRDVQGCVDGLMSRVESGPSGSWRLT